ncbi:hypothetical protein B0H13DRAFT_1861789 [Mycena leptocephala]|nr:hypothetical protein B0H13DRAFT_1861789 [Mycena leptocephala]
MSLGMTHRNIQNVKRNRDDCIRLLENIHQILYTIVNLHIRSETAGSLHPAMQGHIGKFTETLQKIHTFVEAQQNGNKIKYFLRHSEMNTLLKDCHSGLDEVLEVFKIEIGTISFTGIVDMKQKTENMHNELLEFISTLSNSTSDDNSSVYTSNRSQNSSSSFSILPSKPTIFNGRESELKHIVEALTHNTSRVAVIGGGGMGKTSLARAALHHPDIANKFTQRYFVSTESATNSVEVAALIGLDLGLNPGKDLTNPIVQYFFRQPPCLLILDNLETPWEPINSRGAVEELLSLLTDVPQLAMMITMRGAERPSRVAWTHPFLPPLQPLSDDATLKTFIDVTDSSFDNEDMKQLLSFTDNMPLAVDLIAHMVDYEGNTNVLTRWGTEKTSLLSVGHDRRSNLDTSISLSLSSPRITAGAKALLSLLSILPDGLSDVELLQSNLPIKDIRTSKATLLATSLAYIDNRKQLRSLMPIREHIQKFSPPAQSLIDPLRKHFHSLLDLYKKHNEWNTAQQHWNLHQVLHRGLHEDNLDVADNIHCIINLNSFHRVTKRSGTTLMEQIPAVLSQLGNHRLELKFITDVLGSDWMDPKFSPELLIAQGISHCKQFDDPKLEGEFYRSAGFHHFYSTTSPLLALKLFERGLTLSRSCGDTDTQCNILTGIAEIQLRMGNAGTCQIHVNEARRLASLSANLYEEAKALEVASQAALHFGDYQGSIGHLHRARDIVGMCGMQGGSVDFLIDVAMAEVHLLKSEYTEARSIHTQVLQHSDRNATIDATTLVNIAHIDVMIGASGETVRLNLNEAKSKFGTTRYLFGVTSCDMILADLNLREGDISSANNILNGCLRFSWGMHTDLVTFCLERLADRNRWNVMDSASPWPVVYLAYGNQSKGKLALHKALLYLGDVFAAQGDDDTAKSLFTVALEGFLCMDVHHSKAQCLLRLGDLARKKGNLSEAQEFWMAARPLFERSSQAKDVVQIDDRLAEHDNNQKALAHLATLHPPETLLEEQSVEVEGIGSEDGEGAAGQHMPERTVLSAM